MTKARYWRTAFRDDATQKYRAGLGMGRTARGIAIVRPFTPPLFDSIAAAVKFAIAQDTMWILSQIPEEKARLAQEAKGRCAAKT